MGLSKRYDLEGSRYHSRFSAPFRGRNSHGLDALDLPNSCILTFNLPKPQSHLQSDGDAKSCKAAVNGNIYGLANWGALAAFRGVPDDPKDTTIQGRVIAKGSVIAADSRPQSFWFAQVAAATGDAWNWKFGAAAGDPPAQASTLAAVGGAGQMIIGALRYGTGNAYRAGAPKGTDEPLTRQPPAPAMPYLIQRNNNTFQDVDGRPPATGKTILAYCTEKRALLRRVL